jgi:hypothetical protein
MRHLKLDWKRIPWTLWVYAGATLVNSIVSMFIVDESTLVLALLVLFTLTWSYFLLRGVRWLWMFTLAAYVLGMVIEVVSESIHWRGFALGVIGLAVLSLPVTRRFFAADRAAVTA